MHDQFRICFSSKFFLICIRHYVCHGKVRQLKVRFPLGINDDKNSNGIISLESYVLKRALKSICQEMCLSSGEMSSLWVHHMCHIKHNNLTYFIMFSLTKWILFKEIWLLWKPCEARKYDVFSFIWLFISFYPRDCNWSVWNVIPSVL